MLILARESNTPLPEILDWPLSRIVRWIGVSNALLEEIKALNDGQ